MKIRSIIASATLAAAAIGIVGCESDGLSPREGQSQNYSSYFYSQFTGDNLGAPATRPTMHGPVNVVVVQPGEVAPPQEMIDQMQSHKELFARVDSLPGVFDFSPSETDSMSNPRSYTELNSHPEFVQRRLRQIRQAALNFQSQYILLIGGTVDHANDSTPLTLANITIVGAFVVPSQAIYATGRASACLIDAQTGQVIFTVTGDAKRQTIAPSISVPGSEEQLVESIRSDLVKSLTTKLLARMQETRS